MLVPYLTFRDGARSLRFLTDVLGFHVVVEQRGDNGEVVHAELRRGDDVVMGGEGDITPAAAPGLYVVADDRDEVDVVAGRVAGSGGELIEEPVDLDWGSRRTRFRDPDGHEWSVGTYVPGQGW